MISNGIEKFELFPRPSSLAPPKAPPRWPGANSKTTDALMEILKDNHEKWHTFYDDEGRHNHNTHQVLALWFFGAHQDLIRGSYDKNIPLQRPKPEISEAITSSNFNDHLGDMTYYSAYLAFFDDVVRQHKGNPASLMEEYIFSTKANFGSVSQSGQHPQMACRFLELIIHPMIHFGYGVEFGLPGMLVEALAQAAVHPVHFGPMIPESLFTSVLGAPNEARSDGSSVHAFTVVARILADPRFAIPGTNVVDALPKLLKLHAAFAEHVNQWTVDVKKLATDPKEIDRKIEELQWMNTIFYAVCGYKNLKEDKFNADFLYMHLVTSALFLPIIATHLSPTSQALFLRTYFITSLTWWITNGRPAPDIASFMSAEDSTSNNQSHPTPSDPQPPPHPHALSSSSSIATNSNPWLYIVQKASVHPDDHFPKTIRALSHFALMYGQRKAGELDFAHTELKGAEMLDGTFFVRAAGLTTKRLEEIEGDEFCAYWDRPGFFEDGDSTRWVPLNT
jgi:hypothetical protein